MNRCLEQYKFTFWGKYASLQGEQNPPSSLGTFVVLNNIKLNYSVFSYE